MQCECMAVACCQSQSITETDRQLLVGDIVDNQWRDDSVIQHISNHALAKSNTSAQCKHWSCGCQLFLQTGLSFILCITACSECMSSDPCNYTDHEGGDH